MNTPDLHPEELLDKAARDTLSDSEREWLDAHLAQCKVCRFEMQARADFQAVPGAALEVDDLVARALAGIPAADPASDVPSVVTPIRPRRKLSPAWVAAAVLTFTVASFAAVGQISGVLPKLIQTLTAPAPVVEDEAVSPKRKTRAPKSGAEVAAAEIAPEAEPVALPQDPVPVQPQPRAPEEQREVRTPPTQVEVVAPRAQVTPPPSGTRTAPVAAVKSPAQVNSPSRLAETSPVAAAAGTASRSSASASAPSALAKAEPISPVQPALNAAIGGSHDETPEIPLAPVPAPAAAKSAPAAQPEVAKAAPPAAPVVVEPTADALFARANQARVRGDRNEAARRYRELLARFPAAPEAKLTRATLGRLLLDTGDSPGAIDQLDLYLGSGDTTLREEALVAKAMALAKLGRGGEEASAWSQLLDAYPMSLHASRAQQRLVELSR